jgi:hypothetical protein
VILSLLSSADEVVDSGSFSMIVVCGEIFSMIVQALRQDVSN